MINRSSLLEKLEFASAGVTKNETFSQSNCFVFTEKELITFSGTVFTRQSNNFGITGSVESHLLLNLLEKIPDNQISLETKGRDLVIGGKNKKAGIVLQSEISLPWSQIPFPEELWDMPEDLSQALERAVGVCSRDDARPRTTEVHITPNFVEACDNHRLFRQYLKTGLKETLVKASDLKRILPFEFTQIGQSKSWIFFQNHIGIAGVICCLDDYVNLQDLIEFQGVDINLPPELSEVLSRSKIVLEKGGVVKVKVGGSKISLKSEGSGSWYKESGKISFQGPSLKFSVDPKLFTELLKHSKSVKLTNRRIKIESNDYVFMIALEN